MKPWTLADPREYQTLPLRAHSLLADVPIHDVWRLDLPGGGQGRTIPDLRACMSTGSLAENNRIVRGLFGLRTAIGRLLGWDRKEHSAGASSYVHRLSEEDRAASLLKCGSPDGPFTLLYAFEREAVGEIRNATVHAFSVTVIEPTASGYRMFWAIHVAPVGGFTSFYMAAIDPFRRHLVYPAVLKRVHEQWSSNYQAR